MNPPYCICSRCLSLPGDESAHFCTCRREPEREGDVLPRIKIDRKCPDHGSLVPPAEHPFEPSYTGMVCERTVFRDGGGDQCGLSAEEHQRAPLDDLDTA